MPERGCARHKQQPQPLRHPTFRVPCMQPHSVLPPGLVPARHMQVNKPSAAPSDAYHLDVVDSYCPEQRGHAAEFITGLQDAARGHCNHQPAGAASSVNACGQRPTFVHIYAHAGCIRTFCHPPTYGWSPPQCTSAPIVTQSLRPRNRPCNGVANVPPAVVAQQPHRAVPHSQWRHPAHNLQHARPRPRTPPSPGPSCLMQPIRPWRPRGTQR